MFYQFGEYYIIILALQAYCAYHSYKRGTHQKWIWLIVFLPLVGCLIYLFSEVFSSSHVNSVQTGITTLINPGGVIKRLENNLRFADTFNNRVALADAYLSSGQTERAIQLYESSLTGAFTENEHVLMQLVSAYYHVGRYTDSVLAARKISRQPQFYRSSSHTVYAMALAASGDDVAAEKEFMSMAGRYSYFENRYQYGLFLAARKRMNEATNIFDAIVQEGNHLTGYERRNNRQWVQSAKAELKKLIAGVVA
jgi:hypothetical protein